MNPYLIVEVDEKELGRTSRQYNTLNPTWNETLYSEESMDAEDIRLSCTNYRYHQVIMYKLTLSGYHVQTGY